MSDFAPTIPNWSFTRAKTALVRAAAAVMSERGPRAATLKNIAIRAGVTEPAIFRHFPGVDGVFAALALSVEQFYDAFESAFPADQKGIARFERGFRESLRMLTENPEFGFIILHSPSVFREYAELMGNLGKRIEGMHSLAIECMAQAKESGELKEGPDSAFIAELALGSSLRILLDWLESPKGKDPLKSCEAAWSELRKAFVRKRA